MRPAWAGDPTARRAAAPSIVLALTLLLGPVPALAQLARPGAADAGLGEHSVASVRGFSAAAVNPAGLGLGPDRPTAALSVRLGAGLEPVSLGDISRREGEVLPDHVRAEWLERIRRAGTEEGSATAAASPLALSAGRVGVQLSTVAAGRVVLNGDAAELILFGNAGRTGEPRTFDLEGSRLDGWVVSTLAVAYGAPVGTVRGGRLALGVTTKLSAGHALLLGRDVGSTLDGSTPDVRLEFPVLTVEPGSGFLDGPKGVGIDLGAAWEREDLSVGVVLRNAVNTFGWGLDDLVFRPGTALFRGEEETTSDFEPRPAGEAPSVLREAALAFEFGPSVELGIAFPLHPRAELVTSVERTFGHDSRVVPRVRVGAGVEAWASDRLPLRAHASVVEKALRVGGGATLVLGDFRLGGAGSASVGSMEREAWIASFSLSWEGRDRRGG